MSPRRIQSVLTLVALTLGIGVAVFHAFFKPAPEPRDVENIMSYMEESARWQGMYPPDFSLPLRNGEVFQLSDHIGREVIILNFFATWCPPCKAEIPDFIDLQNEYGNRIAFIGVSNEGAGILKGFVERIGINYTVLEDPAKKAIAAYGPIRGVPTTFIIGKDFVIRKMYIGARPREVFEADIKELLAQ